jgi:hypothetical protein
MLCLLPAVYSLLYKVNKFKLTQYILITLIASQGQFKYINYRVYCFETIFWKWVDKILIFNFMKKLDISNDLKSKINFYCPDQFTLKD